MDCPAQSIDRYFAQHIVGLLRIPWIIRSRCSCFAQGMDQADRPS